MSSGATTGVKTYQNYINGKWESAASGKTFPVYDPSTEEVIAHVAASEVADVDRAVKAARAAFDSGPWAQTTAQDRGRVLFRLADKIRQNSAMLAEIECRNSGKPIVEAEYDIADVATCFEYYGGLANKVTGHVNPVPANALSFTMREPVGVAGQIIPWNYPLLMAAWKLAPAIASGCTCVLKPAEQTPLTALEFANWFEEAGLPPGVVNIVNGFGESAGAAIVAHPNVDKIAFTGSAAVGKIIVKSAADTLKRVTLELGGKSPNIFFPDADWEAAVDGALFGVFINQGEVCSAGSRILVEKKIYSKFVEAMTEKAKGIKLGAPLERETKMGPLVSKEQYDRVTSYLDIGRKKPRSPSAAAAPSNSVKAIMSSRRFFTTWKTPRASLAKKFSVPSLPSFPSTANPKPFASPTTRLTAWPPPSGPATSTKPSASSSRFALASFGSITCSRLMSKRPGAATNNPASAASSVPGASKSISKPNRSSSTSTKLPLAGTEMSKRSQCASEIGRASCR